MARVGSGRRRALVVCALDSTAWFLLRHQLRALREHGLEVSVACSGGPYVTRLEQDGFRVHTIRIGRNLNVLAHLVSTARLMRLMRAERYEIVHVHTPIAAIVGRIAARLAGVPLVLYTAHGFYFHDATPARARRWHVRVERWLGRFTSFLFTQSGEDAVTAMREGIMPQSRIGGIGNGVQLNLFSAVDTASTLSWRTRLGLSPNALVVGTVGRLVEEKGFREFFQAAALLAPRFSNAEFVVVGDSVSGDRDSFAAEMKQLLDSNPELQARVKFTGFTEDVPALMGLIDVFVLASYREGMPRSIIEAMAAGKPVVACDIRGCREEVVQGVTGFLVPVRDANALAAKIASLLESRDLREIQGAAGLKRARALYDENDVNARVLGTIDRLLAGVA